ncbi:MAG: hypothetical protein ACRYGK_12620 [Janthinobacterium lividum]
MQAATLQSRRPVGPNPATVMAATVALATGAATPAAIGCMRTSVPRLAFPAAAAAALSSLSTLKLSRHD